jgi:mono/diheme cytochrome c family protein
MAGAGCLACHAVKGQEGFRSEAPPLDPVGLKTGGEAMRRWLTNPKEVDPNATMPNFQLTPEQITELSNYLFNLAAGSSTAALVEAATKEPEGKADNGKKLFAESRCISCHTVEGKGNGSAPELSKVASKATRGWLIAFIRDPHAFNPRTRMPRFGFSDSDIRDLAAYFEQDFKDFDAPKDILDPIRVNQTLAENGAKLFRNMGCFACHGTSAGSDKFGPDLDGIGNKPATSLEFGTRKDLPRTLPAWLEAKIEEPRSMGQNLKMPSYGFSPQDRRSLVTALLALGAQPMPEAYRFTPAFRPGIIPGGKVGAIMDRYRCLSCHQIGDRGGDTSTAPLTFEGSKCRPEWVADYLMLSFTIRPILTDRMPVFRMAKEDATLLAQTFETFYRDPAIPEDPFAGGAREPEEGKRLYDAKGCRGCHILGAGGGYYGPPLNDTGRRLKSGWIYNWLKGPQKWRADVRCPNYGFTDPEALRLTAYLETLKTVAGGAK